VTVASAESAIAEISSHAPELMTEPLRETESGSIALNANLEALAQGKSVVAMGPGLGRVPQIAAMVHAIAGTFEGPMVLDARWAMVGQVSACRAKRSSPHPGEMRAATGKTTAEVKRIASARPAPMPQTTASSSSSKGSAP
jgi:NAD(P)H-hydrate epimerase